MTEGRKSCAYVVNPSEVVGLYGTNCGNVPTSGAMGLAKLAAALAAPAFSRISPNGGLVNNCRFG